MLLYVMLYDALVAYLTRARAAEGRAGAASRALLRETLEATRPLGSAGALTDRNLPAAAGAFGG